MRLVETVDGESAVMGIGLPLASALGLDIPGLHDFPAFSSPGTTIPATPAALWCWLRGDDRGTLLHRARDIEHLSAPSFTLYQSLETFRYENSLDLTGYEDGTENPRNGEAISAAFTAGQGPGLDGGSIAAIQQWVHDLDRFQALPAEEQDNTFGRRKADNEEIDEALFRFTQPITGAYFWCPPMAGGQPDLQALRL